MFQKISQTIKSLNRNQILEYGVNLSSFRFLTVTEKLKNVFMRNKINITVLRFFSRKLKSLSKWQLLRSKAFFFCKKSNSKNEN